jgi:hypothetical protein
MVVFEAGHPSDATAMDSAPAAPSRPTIVRMNLPCLGIGARSATFDGGVGILEGSLASDP